MASYIFSLLILLSGPGVVHSRIPASFLEAAFDTAPDDSHGHEHVLSEKPEKEGAHRSSRPSEDHHGHAQSSQAEAAVQDYHAGSADSVAIGLMAWVILQPLVIYMSLTKAAGGQISFLTLRMIDISISIFLAVLWFSASGDVLKSASLPNLFPHAVGVFATMQVLVLYVVAMLVAYAFRENRYFLLAFCACAGHYIAFAAIEAVGIGQHAAGKLVEEDVRPFMSLIFCAMVLIVFIALSLTSFYSWRMYVDPKSELHFAVDELELDIIGLVLSFAIVQALRHLLSGDYPTAHMLLQVSADRHGDDGHGRSHHTATQRAQMLACAIGFTVLAALSLRYLEAIKERTHYWMHKALHITQVVLVMCAAWAYLLWGQWQFYEHLFRGDRMFGTMVFAIMATVISLVIIVALAYGNSVYSQMQFSNAILQRIADEEFSTAKAYGNLCIMAVSLVTAFSWEHCFHVAIDVLAEQHKAEYGSLLPKILLAILVPIVILPGYLAYVKPVIVEKEEQFCADELSEYRRDLTEVTSPQKDRPDASSLNDNDGRHD